MARIMDLTADHVARAHRLVADPGAAAAALHSDADYAEKVQAILATNPAPDQPIRLFAYGSLIWKPEIPHIAEVEATAHGWHRSFCLKQTRFRGAPDLPGLMMVLDRGGQCKGMLYTLPTEDQSGQLDRLFRREFTVKPITNMPRWITVTVGGQKAAALAFVMNRASANYAGRLAPEAVADVLSKACGHVGSGAEYLFNTVSHLEAKGIHDSALWRLQRLVAQRIEAAPPAAQGHPRPR
ncbi:MAG: gamma-glutamylcyclotransferase [bacterium]